MVFFNETFYYIDVTQEDRQNKVFTVWMDGYSYVYTPFSVLSKTYRGSLIGIFDAVATPSDILYQQDYDEKQRILMFDALNPRQISTCGDWITWVEPDSTGHWDFRLYDTEAQSTISTEIDASADINVARYLPCSCDTYVIYQEVNLTTGASSVWIYYMESKTWEMLNSLTADKRNYFFPSFGLSATDDEAGSANGPNTEPASCRAVWLETTDDIVIDDQLFSTPASTSSLSSLNIHVLLYPFKEKLIFLPSAWATPADGFVYLYNIAISSTYLVAVVATTDFSQFKLRIYSFSSEAWTDMVLASQPMDLASSHDDGFVYWQGSSLYFLKLTGDPSDPWFVTHCLALDENRDTGVLAVSFYHDNLVYLQQTKDNVTGLFRLDLNKDNDALFDWVDNYFPLTGDYTWDSDNDGIGDEADIIEAKGSCRHGARRSCMGDNTLLYIVYGIMMLFVAAGSTVYIVFDVKVKRALARVAPKHHGRRRQLYLQKPADSRAPSSKLAESDNDKDKSAGNNADADAAEKLFRDRLELIGYIMQWFLLILVIVSVALAIVPMWDTTPLDLRTSRIIIWFDWFTSTIFLIDLIVRYFTRDVELTPNLRVFLKQNWYDLPSLLTDVPGVTQVGGAFQFTVAIRLARIFRLLRVFKVFRVIRLYRRLTQQNIFLIMMIERPLMFLSILTGVMIVLMSIWIKILEQEAQPAFADIGNVFWFSLVTTLTVGYGDLVVTNSVARVLAMCMAGVGIGLLGALSAKLVYKILHTEKTEGSLDNRKQRIASQRRQDRMNMEKITQQFNPFNAALSLSKGEHSEDMLREAMEIRLQRRIWLDTDAVTFPLEEMMVAGKFSSYDVASAANRNARLLAQAALLDQKEQVTPATRIKLLLKFFGLHKHREGSLGERFQACLLELGDVLLCPARENEVYLQKAFSLLHHVKSDDGRLDPRFYDLSDPLGVRERSLDDILIKYSIAERFDYHNIRKQLQIIMLLWDRFLAAQWALANLRYKVNVKPAPPLTNAKYRGLPVLHKKQVNWKTAIARIHETTIVINKLRQKYIKGEDSSPENHEKDKGQPSTTGAQTPPATSHSDEEAHEVQFGPQATQNGHVEAAERSRDRDGHLSGRATAALTNQDEQDPLDKTEDNSGDQSQKGHDHSEVRRFSHASTLVADQAGPSNPGVGGDNDSLTQTLPRRPSTGGYAVSTTTPTTVNLPKSAPGTSRPRHSTFARDTVSEPPMDLAQRSGPKGSGDSKQPLAKRLSLPAMIPSALTLAGTARAASEVDAQNSAVLGIKRRGSLTGGSLAGDSEALTNKLLALSAPMEPPASHPKPPVISSVALGDRVLHFDDPTFSPFLSPVGSINGISKTDMHREMNEINSSSMGTRGTKP